jgi:hypothetical protein
LDLDQHELNQITKPIPASATSELPLPQTLTAIQPSQDILSEISAELGITQKPTRFLPTPTRSSFGQASLQILE